MGNQHLDSPSAPTSPTGNPGEAPSPDMRSPDDAFSVYAFLSQEVQAKLGKDFLGKMPLDLMERYCLATVENGHPTADMLYELVTNFLTAYANPATKEDALKALDYLGYQAEQADQ
ncbi:MULTISPECIES: hypothetical protein [Pseudomonas]|uniref:hypothetical protein n=1 Tax=Pseudomonas TaxID=286 RepID=UPI0012E35268|nr:MULTISPECIES: hypothetical protein [Pseudomonas]WHS57587.1 hypothetical protein QLH64_30000 [Pseudomonas brassicacearum]